MKKEPKKQDESIKHDRHMSVLLEKIYSEVKTIAEGHSGIVKKLEDHDKRFDEVAADIGDVKEVVGSVKSDVSTLKSEFKTFKAALFDTNDRVKDIEKKLDTKVSDHEKRIQKLEIAVH